MPSRWVRFGVVRLLERLEYGDDGGDVGAITWPDREPPGDLLVGKLLIIREGDADWYRDHFADRAVWIEADGRVRGERLSARAVWHLPVSTPGPVFVGGYVREGVGGDWNDGTSYEFVEPVGKIVVGGI